MKSAAALTSALSLSRPSTTTMFLSPSPYLPTSFSRLLSHSISPILPPAFNSLPIFFRPKSSSPIFILRNSNSSITAKPSSDLRRNRGGSSAAAEQDQKLVALRELFKKPGVNIDAYIIPSQDAHQVLPFSNFWYRKSKRNWNWTSWCWLLSRSF